MSRDGKRMIKSSMSKTKTREIYFSLSKRKNRRPLYTKDRLTEECLERLRES